VSAGTRQRLEEPLRTAVGKSGPALSTALGLHTVGDLLRHYPRRYAQRGELTDLGSLRVGEEVTVLARVRSVTRRPMRHRKGSLLEVVVTDGTGDLLLTFFKQTWREKDLRTGRRGLFAGKVGSFKGHPQLTHPECRVLGADDERADAAGYTDELIPIYPSTGKLKTWTVGDAVRMVLDTLREDDVPDPVPSDVRERHGLVSLREAFELVHRPRTPADWRRAHQRLRWDEAFTLQVVLAGRRAAARALPATPRPARPGGLLSDFDAALPFTLTTGQREVAAAIEADLARDHPMHRLLQGEVASGKTVVALRAMLAVVDAGGQAALLAPTEVLAQQHHRSLRALLGPLAEGGLLGGAEHGTRVALLTGSQPTPARRQALLDVASGEAGIVVGTHALLQEAVTFFDLGLVVVDEQHRFGVEQRDALRGKASKPPHVLVMTATPIPRTVAMTVFGDLEVSTLSELPQGRAPITTHVVPAGDKPHFLERAWQRVREEVASGGQAYVVCPRIGGEEDTSGAGSGTAEGARPDDGDGVGLGDGSASPDDSGRRAPLAVLDIAPMLCAGPLAGLRVGVLHGRLPADTKDDLMRRFANGEVDVLVATTVIEVGVDVANATVMVVLDADRFGVSQLHQLRGRVGRGGAPGLCLLVTDLPHSAGARERLDAVAATLDGFELSRVDLEQRREGDVLGVSQSGRRSSLRLLRAIRDEDVIVAAREEAAQLVERDPDLQTQPVLAAAVSALLEDDRSEYLEKA
jgi:ATP-dependent DNA helicase RecG